MLAYQLTTLLRSEIRQLDHLPESHQQGLRATVDRIEGSQLGRRLKAGLKGQRIEQPVRRAIRSSLEDSGMSYQMSLDGSLPGTKLIIAEMLRRVLPVDQTGPGRIAAIEFALDRGADEDVLATLIETVTGVEGEEPQTGAEDRARALLQAKGVEPAADTETLIGQLCDLVEGQDGPA